MTRHLHVAALVGVFGVVEANASSVVHVRPDRALHDRVESVPDVELTPAELTRLGKDQVAQVRVYARCIEAAQEGALACGWLTTLPRQPAGTMTGALQALLDDAWRKDPSSVEEVYARDGVAGVIARMLVRGMPLGSEEASLLLAAYDGRDAESIEHSRFNDYLRLLAQESPNESIRSKLVRAYKRSMNRSEEFLSLRAAELGRPAGAELARMHAEGVFLTLGSVTQAFDIVGKALAELDRPLAQAFYGEPWPELDAGVRERGRDMLGDGARDAFCFESRAALALWALAEIQRRPMDADDDFEADWITR